MCKYLHLKYNVMYMTLYSSVCLSVCVEIEAPNFADRRGYSSNTAPTEVATARLVQAARRRRGY